IAEAVDLSKLHGKQAVNQALEACARAGRFADGDLARILSHQQQTGGGELIPFPRGEESSLQASTRGWEGLGR
ncbi:MAG: IS21 family transposase, partial [Solirubrobacteraceae bacterium]